MSNRFARVTEEVILRRKELAVEHHKTGKLGRSALETLFLYIVILLHSWETGVLDKKKFPKLCEIYDLDVDNSYRRLKTMKQKGWVEITKSYIRPLLTHRSKTVTVTANEAEKTVTVTPKPAAKTVTITDENCNSYSKSDEKTVTVTVENDETSIPVSDYDDSKTLLNLNKADSTTSSSEKTQSRFSIEECLRYIEIRLERGERIETPHRLVRWLHTTGKDDAFIQATLYPEQINAEQQVEYADDFYDAPAPETLDKRILEVHLWDYKVLGLVGEELSEIEKNYTPEDWAWLMEELRNVEQR